MDIVSAIKASPSLLNTVFDHMTSAVFIVDKHLEVKAFNHSFEKWVKRSAQDVFNHLCGNVLGCVYSSSMQEACGNTSFCKDCDLRLSIIKAVESGIITSNQTIEREFEIDGSYELKFFRYTCKSIVYEEETFAILMLDDVTDIELKKRELQEQNNLIKRLNIKFQQELQLAQKVQASLIPKSSLAFGVYDIDFKYFPLDEIGGDMFDVFEIDENRIGIFMCDVIGHGLPAALITTMVKAFIASSRDLLHSPSQLMDHLNNQLINLVDTPYMTAFYGVLDYKAHELNFVRAGHPLPLMIEGKVTSFGKERNPMLGILKAFSFVEELIEIRPQAKILLFTDGLSEASTSEGEYESRLIELCSQYGLEKGSELLDIIAQDVKEISPLAAQRDDICMLVIDRKDSCVSQSLIG